MSQTDRELLELAAKAEGRPAPYDQHGVFSAWVGDHIGNGHWWDPLSDDGDALRLAVTLKMQIIVHGDWVEAMIDGIQLSSPASCYSADGSLSETTRRAIVRAAAAIGSDMP